MSILVEGIKMPKNCGECPFLADEQGFCSAYTKQCIDIDDWDKRQEWCPLVEVKTPHGRLIEDNDVIDQIDEWLDVVDDALAKQIEKKLISGKREGELICPNCDGVFFDCSNHYPYCPACGQKLKWWDEK